MESQRINVYIGADNTPVFYIEQWLLDHSAWVTVGAVYKQFEMAESTVSLFNSRQIFKQIAALKPQIERKV